MSNVTGVTIPMDIRTPFEFRGVRVARPDVARLELFELLLRAEFVGLYIINNQSTMSMSMSMLGLKGREGGRKEGGGGRRGEPTMFG